MAVKTARVDNDVESDPGLEINDSKSLAAGSFLMRVFLALDCVKCGETLPGRLTDRSSNALASSSESKDWLRIQSSDQLSI